MGKTFGELTWPEIDAYLRAHPDNASIIVPIGPVEEHGPHLHLDADISSALAIALGVAAQHHCLVFPPVPLMVCGISRPTNGTYSIEPETLRLVARDLLIQLSSKGFRNILFFTGHGGFSMKIITEEITAVLGKSLARGIILNFETACPTQHHIVGVDSRDMHAAGNETARMMNATPDQVRWDLIPPADYHKDGNKVLSDSGISGDPQKATPEKGAEIVRITVETLLAWLNQS